MARSSRGSRSHAARRGGLHGLFLLLAACGLLACGHASSRDVAEGAPTDDVTVTGLTLDARVCIIDGGVPEISTSGLESERRRSSGCEPLSGAHVHHVGTDGHVEEMGVSGPDGCIRATLPSRSSGALAVVSDRASGFQIPVAMLLASLPANAAEAHVWIGLPRAAGECPAPESNASQGGEAGAQAGG